MIKILIWGTGEQCQELLNKINFDREEIIGFIDKNETKIGTEFHNNKIMSPKSISKISFDKIIIASTKYHSEILQELLQEYDIKKESILSLYEFISQKLENKEEKLIGFKHDSELDFWKKAIGSKENIFSYYKKMFEDICEEDAEDIVKDKVIVDFGCGPRGSLKWAMDMGALLGIGVDVLVDRYWDEFGEQLTHHKMIYVKSTEKYIPMPSDFADIIITINSMDHVNDLARMARENLRILKKGGMFVASFNLNEAKTACEPQTLTLDQIKHYFYSNLEIKKCRIAYKVTNNVYKNFHTNNLVLEEELDNNKEAIMWLVAIKKN